MHRNVLVGLLAVTVTYASGCSSDPVQESEAEEALVSRQISPINSPEVDIWENSGTSYLEETCSGFGARQTCKALPHLITINGLRLATSIDSGKLYVVATSGTPRVWDVTPAGSAFDYDNLAKDFAVTGFVSGSNVEVPYWDRTANARRMLTIRPANRNSLQLNDGSGNRTVTALADRRMTSALRRLVRRDYNSSHNILRVVARRSDSEHQTLFVRFGDRSSSAEATFDLDLDLDKIVSVSSDSALDLVVTGIKNCKVVHYRATFTKPSGSSVPNMAKVAEVTL